MSYHSVPIMVIRSKYYLSDLYAFKCKTYNTMVIYLYTKVLTNNPIVYLDTYVNLHNITNLSVLDGGYSLHGIHWSPWHEPL